MILASGGELSRANLDARGARVIITLPRSRTAQHADRAMQLGGHQYSAHLSLLWDGTTLNAKAQTVGMQLGTLGMVAKALLTKDPRLTWLPQQERDQVLSIADDHLAALEASGLGCAKLMSAYARPALGRAREVLCG